MLLALVTNIAQIRGKVYVVAMAVEGEQSLTRVRAVFVTNATSILSQNQGNSNQHVWVF